MAAAKRSTFTGRGCTHFRQFTCSWAKAPPFFIDFSPLSNGTTALGFCEMQLGAPFDIVIWMSSGGSKK